MSDLLKLAALWKNQSKDGRTYLSGYLGDCKVLVMANQYARAGSKDPTHHIFLAPKEKKPKNGDRTEQRQSTRDEAQGCYPPPPEDEIPF